MVYCWSHDLSAFSLLCFLLCLLMQYTLSTTELGFAYLGVSPINFLSRNHIESNTYYILLPQGYSRGFAYAGQIMFFSLFQFKDVMVNQDIWTLLEIFAACSNSNIPSHTSYLTLLWFTLVYHWYVLTNFIFVWIWEQSLRPNGSNH